MAQIAEMREPHAWQTMPLGSVGRGETGEVAVGERQDHDVARRLAEIDRFDAVVEARSCGLEQMHGYPRNALVTASRSRPLRPITTRFPARASAPPQARS